MIYINKVSPFKLIRTQFFTPINLKNKRIGHLLFCLMPTYDSLVNFFINNKIMQNYNMYKSYYTEKNIKYYISDAGIIDSNNNVVVDSKNESVLLDYYNILNESLDEYILTKDFLLEENTITFFNENAADSRIKTVLYKDRIRSNKDLMEFYNNRVKMDMPFIKNTFTSIKSYKGQNLIVDMSKYLEKYLAIEKGTKRDVDILYNLISRFILDRRFYDYTGRSVLINVKDWIPSDQIKPAQFLNIKNKLTPFSLIYYLFKHKLSYKLDYWNDIDFIITSNKCWFKFRFNNLNKQSLNTFIRNITLMTKESDNSEALGDEVAQDSVEKATEITTGIENHLNISINSISGEDDPSISANDKAAAKIAIAAASSKTEEDASKELDKDDNFKKALLNLRAEQDEKEKLSNARIKRFNELDNKFINSQLDNKKVGDLISIGNVKLDATDIKKVESIDEQWDGLTKPNFEKAYDINSDIAKIIHSFREKDVPMHVVKIESEDTSTSEDYVNTYKVVFEDNNGTRHNLTFDVPKFINNRLFKLRGNLKTLSGQLINLPIIKTDENTVQVVSNYNKMFIRLNKSAANSSYKGSAVIKTLNKLIEDKYNGCNFIKSISIGNNSKICKKYILPIDYIEISREFNKIDFKNGNSIIFDQDKLREKLNYNNPDKSKFPIGTGDIPVVTQDSYIDDLIEYLSNDEKFVEVFNKYYSSQKSTAYSEVSILNSSIPLIVVMAYSVGLTKALNKAKIKFDFTETRPNKKVPYIKFKDGYMTYEDSPDAIILLSALFKIDTEDYSIGEIDSKQTWIDILDDLGIMYKADGLDAFYNLMMDPITVDICQNYNLPFEYIEVLAYASSLLVNNDFTRHVDITGNRYRTNERIAHFVYKALSTSYSQFLRDYKNNKNNAKMTIKKSAVIDLALQDATMSDFSVLNPLLEMESNNAVSFKGLSGMNSDRSYQLDKRTYDDSMINKLAMSTGFSANVGINRQTTINMDIKDSRGYLNKNANVKNEMNDVNTLSMTEALTPLGSTHDDPFRSAMTFIQTAKHELRTMKSDPLLVSNGADQALPYLTSDLFAFKAKADGQVEKITSDYMVIRYKSGAKDYIDLRNKVEKNSDGGFFVNLKLSPDLKEKAKFKKGDILAYDKESYSDNTGNGNLAYNIGKLAKIAIMQTDEGFEDSAVISDRLTEAMSTNMVVKKEVVIDKNDTVLNYLLAGTNVSEGDTVFSYTVSDEDEYSSSILNKLIDNKEFINNLGNINLTSKVSGTIQDIKVYSTVDTKEMSPTVKKFVNKIYEKEDSFNKAIGVHIRNKVLPPIGKLKNLEDKILIEYYFTYKDDMSIGDKIVYFSALKGTIRNIFPKDQEPRSEYRPNESIDSLLSIGSINGRMVGSVPILTGLNKIMVELDRHVKDIMGVPYDDNL